jgi:hypothetical protein
MDQQMHKEVLRSPTKELVPGFEPIFEYGSAGERLVEYALGCAISGPVDYFANGSAHTFPSAGEKVGLLATTAGWTSPGLSANQPAREDLHTCIATRLNPSGQQVNIWLEGSHVASKEPPASADPILEAHWLTEYTSDGPRIHVWPSDDVAKSCLQFPIKDVIKKRICGAAPGKCNFDTHSIADCKDDPTKPNYKACPSPATGSLRSVITTKLTCSAFCSLYPSCNVPKGHECPGEGTPCLVPPIIPVKCIGSP